MSLRDDIDADVQDVFLDTDELARSITRNIAGSTSNTATVTGVFVPHMVSREETPNDQQTHTASLHLDKDQAATIDDTWVIGGDTWQTVSVGDDHGVGMRELMLRRIDKKQTARLGRVR